METMHFNLPEAEVCERARRARDARFDGRFFIAVKTTGIYCRPICPAPTAQARNVSYFLTAAAAAEAGFRPCLRCRPEAAPGTPAWSGTSVTVTRALRLINDGALDDGSVAMLAERLGVTTRHLSRLFREHLGASPITIAQHRRLQFAKRLLDETTLKVSDVALAAGFGSVRRFNHVIRSTWGRSPVELRRPREPSADDADCIRLRIPFRPPFDWVHWLSFLERRAIPGVEKVNANGYSRVLHGHGGQGDGNGDVNGGSVQAFLNIRPLPGEHAACLTIQGAPSASLFNVASRARHLLDAEADPVSIREVLSRDDLLAECVSKRPGLRVPGAWDPFELSVRAILGQQISVAAARTLAARLVENHGVRLEKPPMDALTHAFPAPAILAGAPLEDIGLPAARANALRALALACAEGRVRFDEAPEVVCEQLQSLPGIGPWTAQYISMRALRDPDALPAGDLVLRQMLGGRTGNGKPVSEREARRRAEAWRPWRAYALMHLWAKASDGI